LPSPKQKGEEGEKSNDSRHQRPEEKGGREAERRKEGERKGGREARGREEEGKREGGEKKGGRKGGDRRKGGERREEGREEEGRAGHTGQRSDSVCVHVPAMRMRKTSMRMPYRA